MPQTPEQKAAWSARRRAERIAGRVDVLAKKLPKEEVRALTKAETVAGLVRWIEALKQHWSWIGQSVGDLKRLVERTEARMDEHLGLMGQLADQNVLLRDQLALSNWRIEQLETRFGLLRVALADDIPALTSLGEVMADLDTEGI